MDPTQTALMLAGFLLIMGSLMLPRLLKRVSGRRGAKPQPAVVEINPQDEAQLAAAREVVVQLDQLSTRAFARLDTKLRLMNRLIEDADVRLRQLRTLEADRA